MFLLDLLIFILKQAFPKTFNLNDMMIKTLFLQGHEDKFTVYVHASKEKPAHVSPYFVGRDIHSETVKLSS